MLSQAISKIVDGHDLERAEAEAAMRTIMNGEATPAQIAGFLVALRMKGETVDEIVGAAEAMRAAAVRLVVDAERLVDTCGTGGDGAGTFNISTAAAFVAAGAGVPVAKHGNRAVSSGCGSADVLEALGVTLLGDRQRLTECLEAANIAFLFAPFQHPAMKHAVGPRKELGLRTVFNILGPLTNPAGARRQLMGVFDPGLAETLAAVLGELGAERALVVHGAGGIDELSTLGPSLIAEWDAGSLRTYSLEPEELGLERAAPTAIAGGSPADNAATIRAVLAGERGPAADIVVLNAAAATFAGGRVDSLAEGVEAARESIASGRAAGCLEALIACTAPAPDDDPEEPDAAADESVQPVEGRAE